MERIQHIETHELKRPREEKVSFVLTTGMNMFAERDFEG